MTIPPALTALDWLLLAVIVIGLSVRAWFGMRALRRAPEADVAATRRRMWGRGIATQWLLVAALAALWVAQQRTAGALGITVRFTPGLAGVLAGLAFVGVLVLRQRRDLGRSPELAQRVRDRLAPVARLMPAARTEWPRFAALAVTAGICEELLFRGFVTWALAQLLPAWWMALVLQGVLFGLAHTYQGARGVVTTGVVGLFLGGVVFVSGSIWPAMLVHALMDLNAGGMALQVATAPPTARPGTA